MLNVLGSLMLFFGCTAIGLLRIKQMDKRIGALRSLVCTLEVMERELSFRMPLLEEMLAAAIRSTEGSCKMFYSLCRKELTKGLDKPFCEIWSQAAQEQLLLLKKSDLDPVLTLGSILGRYDADGQRQAIARSRMALERVLSDAQAERSSRGKVYGVLGTTAGAFLVILLL